jgi:putative membrane protein
MMWWNGEWNGGAWLAMSVSMVVFWGLVIWAVLSVVRSANVTSSERSDPPPPEQILKERFARGEIDAQEYEQRRDVLRR